MSDKILLGRIAHALGVVAPGEPHKAPDVQMALAIIREAQGGRGYPTAARVKGDHSDITITPGVSAFTGRGYVKMEWGDEGGQLTVKEARAHALALLQAAEAAEMDAAIWAFAHEKLMAGDDGAGAILIAIREYRAAEGAREGG